MVYLDPGRASDTSLCNPLGTCGLLLEGTFQALSFLVNIGLQYENHNQILGMRHVEQPSEI